MFHIVKSFAEVLSKKANCFTIRVIQVAVGPLLNWQESIGTVSTFSVGELWGAEVAFNCLAGIAVVHNFLKSPRYNRSYINAAIITMCFRNTMIQFLINSQYISLYNGLYNPPELILTKNDYSLFLKSQTSKIYKNVTL